MRKKLLSLLVLFILVTSALVGCEQPCTPTMFSVTAGNVSVMKAGAANWTKAQAEMCLERGDIIECGDESSGEITFPDGSIIELQAGAEIEIASLHVSTGGGSATIELKQTIGSIIFRVTKIVDRASRYEIETPTGTVAIRGSAVQVNVIEDGTTWAINLEGDIRVEAQGVELQVPEGRRCIISPDQPPELVIFTDPNLEAAIREAIGKPTGDIHSSDLEGLTSLDATERNITYLTGLQYCISLTYLELSYNQISDISPLADLTGLSMLILTVNQISDISPLAGLTSLTVLGLPVNQISDVSPLANLTNLTELYLHYNQITDISPLSNITSLTDLYLYHNQITDISPLTNLTSLAGLAINDNQISDISPLANLTNLTLLYLDHNQITDISSLNNLTDLTDLYLHYNQITDISPLSSVTSLWYLQLDDNQITDIDPLVQNEGLGGGDEVYLRSNPLSSDSINIYIPQLRARGVAVAY
jgi:hypothetical protein